MWTFIRRLQKCYQYDLSIPVMEGIVFVYIFRAISFAGRLNEYSQFACLLQLIRCFLFANVNESLKSGWTLFRSINPPPECIGSSVRSISRGSFSGIWILECHSGKYGLHSSLCSPNWKDDSAAISSELETARNHTGSNRDYKVGCCIMSIWLLASQASMILAMGGRELSRCKIH